MAFNTDKYNNSSFNRDGVLYVTSASTSKWNNVAYTEGFYSNFVYNNINYIEFLDGFEWDTLARTEEFFDIVKWINREFVDNSEIIQWNNISYLTSLSDFKWGNKNYLRDLRFNQEKYNKSSFNRGTYYVSISDIVKWKNSMFIEDSDVLKWTNRVYTDDYTSIVTWLNRMFVFQDSSIKWNNRMFTGLGVWIEVAPTLGDETEILSLVILDGEIYGSTYPTGKLYKWNGVNAWTEVAPTLGDETEILSLVVLSGEIYGSTYNNGKLYKWNGLNAWIEVAPMLSEEIGVTDLIILDGEIYGSTYPSGKLYKWNGVNAWTEVAPTLGDETEILSLVVLSGEIYGSTYTGKLYKWNGVNAWTEVAPTLGDETEILSLVVLSGEIYGSTYTGKLYKWNGSSSWTEIDIYLEGEIYISHLIVFNGEIYGVSYPSGRLYKNNIFNNIFQWNGVYYNTSSSVLKWNNQMFLSQSSNVKWNEVCYVPDQIIFTWLNVSGVVYPLIDCLSVKTVQGEYIFPNIISGNISFKDGSIGEASFELDRSIPEDSQCAFYLKGSTRMFDGVSRRCTRNSNGTYKANIQEYSEILKPENEKGGVYLVKNDWHNVELHNLVSSLKPTENDGEIGLLYMAFSAIPDSFFKEYDTDNNIFKFEYIGIPYIITEIFEDSSLLPQQTSLEFLKNTVLTTGLIYDGVETEISVNSTVNFGSSGSIYIDDEQITYTSKTATQFTGCVRGAGGTTKLTHSVGTIINPKQRASCLLTTALASGGSETTLSVNNTTNFDSSGMVFIDGEIISYTSKTDTSFNGCVRAINSWTKKECAVGSLVTHNTNISGWYHDSENRSLYIRCSDGTFPYYHVISSPYIWDSSVPIRIGNISSSITQSPATTIYSGDSGTTKIPTAQPPDGGCYLRITGTGTEGDIIITGVATDSSTSETISASDFDVTNTAISAKKWISISNLNIATWDSVVVQSSTPIIVYWETANGDVPFDNLETLLTALDLEYEFVFRNGICYVDISDKIGSGTSNSPANYYSEKYNIDSISEIDKADARNMINGVMFSGYGSGAAGVKSGRHINMGRGGRFVLLDDSTIHSQAVADNFVVKYLNEHYLPSRSIKFTAPLFIGDAVDQRKIGDTAHISIPSEFVEQDLRIKEIAIKLKPLSQTLTFGDRLISYDDQIKAMRAASEKYRKHLQDEIEEFSWSWSENVDSSAARTNTFEITSDILKIQKLELTCNTSFHVTDTSSGSGSGGGGGGGGGGSEENPAGTISSTTHHHQVVGVTGVPSATIQVSAKGHTHTIDPTTSAPSETSTVVTGVNSVAITTTKTPTWGCCTAIGCGKQWLSNYDVTVTGGVGTVTSTNVSSATHTHSVSGTTTGDDSYQSVSTFDHIHQINLQTSDAEAGSALFTAPDYISQFTYKDQGGILTNIVTGRPYGEGQEDIIYQTYVENPDYRFKATDIYTLFRGGGNPDLDPEILFTIKLSGPGIINEQEIMGSPFLVKVSDDIGNVLIDNLVRESGTYTVHVSVAHNTDPTEKVQLRFSMQIGGQIFVDTILKE